MKIIFIKDVKNQGKKDEIKEVKTGFGEFLIKSGNAVLYTNKSVEVLKKEQKEKADKEEQVIKEANILKGKLEKLNLSFKVKTGEKDKVFGNISSKHISEELKNKGYEIDKNKIEIAYPLNMLGKYTVKVLIYKGVNADLKVELKK